MSSERTPRQVTYPVRGQADRTVRRCQTRDVASAAPGRSSSYWDDAPSPTSTPHSAHQRRARSVGRMTYRMPSSLARSDAPVADGWHALKHRLRSEPCVPAMAGGAPDGTAGREVASECGARLGLQADRDSPLGHRTLDHHPCHVARSPIAWLPSRPRRPANWVADRHDRIDDGPPRGTGTPVRRSGRCPRAPMSGAHVRSPTGRAWSVALLVSEAIVDTVPCHEPATASGPLRARRDSAGGLLPDAPPHHRPARIRLRPPGRQPPAPRRPRRPRSAGGAPASSRSRLTRRPTSSPTTSCLATRPPASGSSAGRCNSRRARGASHRSAAG